MSAGLGDFTFTCDLGRRCAAFLCLGNDRARVIAFAGVLGGHTVHLLILDLALLNDELPSLARALDLMVAASLGVTEPAFSALPTRLNAALAWLASLSGNLRLPWRPKACLGRA